MTTTYNIYSSNGFIAFCFIYNNGNSIQGGLSLFETISIENDLRMIQQPGKHIKYTLGTSDTAIITDLMQATIPSFRTNGLSYMAFDIKGKSQII